MNWLKLTVYCHISSYNKKLHLIGMMKNGVNTVCILYKCVFLMFTYYYKHILDGKIYLLQGLTEHSMFAVHKVFSLYSNPTTPTAVRWHRFTSIIHWNKINMQHEYCSSSLNILKPPDNNHQFYMWEQSLILYSSYCLATRSFERQKSQLSTHH